MIKRFLIVIAMLLVLLPAGAQHRALTETRVEPFVTAAPITFTGATTLSGGATAANGQSVLGIIVGDVTMAAASTTAIVTNSAVSATSKIFATPLSGTVLNFGLTRGSGSFTLTVYNSIGVASAPGAITTFTYMIIP